MPGRVKATAAPSGGSAVHEVFSKRGAATSVGAISLDPAVGKAAAFLDALDLVDQA